MKDKFMSQLQRFGGAMFTPVLLFIFPGILVGVATVFMNPEIMGSIANEGTAWSNIWSIISDGGWTIFNHMELFFVIGLPLGLAKKAKGRAAMEALLLYLTFNYFISGIMTYYGAAFGIDFVAEAGGMSGLKYIAGIKTLDTGVLGAIVIAGVSIWIHNKYFDVQLPEWLSVFQGSALVTMVGFWIMLVMAVIFSFIWPKLQLAIIGLQTFMATSGNVGVFTYIFLEKALLPTGLHHFIYAPFQYGPAVVEGGTTHYWMTHMSEFAASTEPLKTLFPQGGFALQGLSNLFGIPGIALAFYSTAKKENRKKVLSLIIPGVITAVMAGITEPFDYTFLFVAPMLFLVHAVLAAILATTMYIFGVVGDMGGGLIELIFKNWIPMWNNHSSVYITQVIIGIIFIAIYYFVFRYLILKFNFATPGRESDKGAEAQFFTKDDYRNRNKKSDEGVVIEDEQGDKLDVQAKAFFELLGGMDNIEHLNNCATRLRVTVKDEDLVDTDDNHFAEYGSLGVVRNGSSYQIIIGLSVSQLRSRMEEMM